MSIAEVGYEAQVGVLGSMLGKPELIGQVLAKVRAEDFTAPVYRNIFQTIAGMFLEGKPVDPMLVRERMSGIGNMSETLYQIMMLTPTAANVWEYVTEMKRQAALATLREIGMALERVLILEDAQALVDRANSVFSSRPGVERLSAKQIVEDFMDRHGEGKHPDYLPWSLPKLDNTMYIEKGDMVLLGGYPSAGKTALALRFAWTMARTLRVGFYSLETKPSKLGDRSVSSIAGIDMKAIKHSALTDGDWIKLADHAEDMADCSLDLIPAGGMTVGDIQADALAHRYEVIFVDYVQLVKTTIRSGNRTEIVTANSIELHQMAQTHGITVVALSQLSRAKTTADGKPVAPTMSSLRESGQLEQDADAILLLFKDYPDKENNHRVLRVAKNKEGSLGEFRLDFDGRTQTFRQSEEKPAYRQMTWAEITNEPDENFPF